MLPRKITSVLRRRLDGYPAVALVGPRQCGKTTLARSFRARYYDLEQETDRLRLDLEWSQVQANNDRNYSPPRAIARCSGACLV